jgi:hypothetical protein
MERRIRYGFGSHFTDPMLYNFTALIYECS